MSMLAEHRRKTKWVINPTKKPIWSTDSSGIKFGKQLMEKMGWSAGKGLGLNEQGIQEPLKVSFKNDTKGMGFKGNDDDWIEHQDEFNTLLNQLRSNDDSSDKKDVGTNEIKSLEEKSKQSKARVHYQKFTRGKDLSRYSENDLACILGTGKTKKRNIPKTEEVLKNEPEGSSNFETSFGVTTINSGSINDYFKKKWSIDKRKPNNLSSAASEAEEEEALNFRPSFSNRESCFSKNDGLLMKPEVEGQQPSKKKLEVKPKEELLAMEGGSGSNSVETENIVKGSKKKRKVEGVEINLEEDPENKKRRKYSDENGGHVTDSLPLPNENNGKRKKDKSLALTEVSYDEIGSHKEKKQRKKAKRNVEECALDNGIIPEEVNGVNNGDNIVEAETSTKKNKREEKKEKIEEYIIIDHKSSTPAEISNPEAGKFIEEPVKHKKKQKEKLEKAEELDNTVHDLHSSNQKKYSFSGVENAEKCSGTCQNENVLELVKKKKKKKDKKEKVEEFVNINSDVPCSDMNQVSAVAAEINNTNEVENSMELELSKKKKKKAKKQKEDNDIENEDYHRNQAGEPHLEGTPLSGNTNGICEKEDTLEVEYEKKEKRKKEKNREGTESKRDEPCLRVGEIKDNTSDVEYVEKKKKKHKKEKLQKNGGTEEKEDCCNEMTNREDSCTRNNEVNGTLNGNNEEDYNIQNTEYRIQKLRSNLFPDQAAVKYFPGQATNERVLKLIRWASIKEFKGSNLSDLEGYGRRMIYQKQSR